jgi:hypothetical protein
VPAGTRITDRSRRVVFESTDALTVSPAWLNIAPDEPAAGSIVTLAAGQSLDRTALSASATAFEALGPSPVIGDALLLGFESAPVPDGGALSIHVWTPSHATDPMTADALREEQKRAAAACAPTDDGPWPTKAQCEERAPIAPAPSNLKPLDHYRATTVWEYWTDAGEWREFATVVDCSRALTSSGSIRLQGAAGHVRGPDDGLYWLRCRLARGGYDCPPVLIRVAVNTVTVVHRSAIDAPEQLGTSDGAPGQEYELAHRPVVPGSTLIRLVHRDGTTDDAWSEVTEWDESGPNARHFRTDFTRPAISFGDGRRGAVPPDGAAIVARTYDIGGGPGGNVPADTLTTMPRSSSSSLRVHQPFAASGGVPAETLAEAHGRALDRLAEPTRGVTTQDVEELVRRTPGVPIARVKAIAGFHPAFPCLPAPGVVTVVVLPPCGSPPRPSPQLLEEIRRFLDRRRPLTTELHVVGPEYVEVSVRATLHVSLGSRADTVAAARTALDSFLHPLRGGTEREGWPFGRDVLESDVLAVLQSLPEVVYVEQVSISVDGAQRCGNGPLCGIQLVASQRHEIIVREDG